MPAFLERLVRGVMRHRLKVIAAYALLAVGATYLSLTRLSVDSDPAALLSSELPWRQADIAYQRAFPAQQNTIMALIESPDADAADTAVSTLRARLAQAGSAIAEVYAPGSGDFFDRNGLLYLKVAELEDMSRRLEQAQPLLGRLSADPSIAGLLDLLREILEAPEGTLPFSLARFSDRIADTLHAAAREPASAKPLSWSALLHEGPSSETQRRFVIITPARHAEVAALSIVREAVARMEPAEARIRLGGQVPLWQDELSAANVGAWSSAIASLLLVAALLYFGLRSLRLVALCMVGLLAGMAITAGFAAIAVGRLNLISIAFSVLYIGLGIDYSAHYTIRYRELIGQGLAHAEALPRASADVGGALLLCALTTASAFFAFIPTSFRGVAELGIISGAGILIGLIINLSLLPALIAQWPPRALPPLTAGRLRPFLTRLAALPAKRARAVRWLSLVLFVAALASLPILRFDHNPMHLKPRHTESLQVYEELVAGKHSPLSATLLAANAREANALAARFEALPEVRHALTLQSFVPEDQENKLAILGELALSLGSGPPAGLKLAPVEPLRDLAGLRASHDAARSFRGKDDDRAAARRLAEGIDAWLAADTNPAARLPSLQRLLLGSLPQLMRRLHLGLQAETVAVDDLPEDLRRQWISADGRHRVEILPHENLNEDAALIRFVDAVHGLEPSATGAPVHYVEGARAVIEAFLQAFATALGITVLLLLVVLRDVADALRALTPLLLGTVLLVAVTVLLRLPLNFANIIALPLLLGISMDTGIHVLWRSRHADSGETNALMSGTGLAVLIATVTTLSSFASLMFSAHRGMASMGLLLTLGLSLMLACTFFVLPALLPQNSRNDLPS